MADKQSLLVDIGQGLSLMTGLPAVLSWKSSDRPKNPKRGTFGFNSQTKTLEYFDGSNWFASRMSEA